MVFVPLQHFVFIFMILWVFLIAFSVFLSFLFISIRFRGAFCCVYSLDDERVKRKKKQEWKTFSHAVTVCLLSCSHACVRCILWMGRKGSKRKKERKITRKIKSREHNTRTQWICLSRKWIEAFSAQTYTRMNQCRATNTHTYPKAMHIQVKKTLLQLNDDEDIEQNWRSKKKTKTTSFIAARMLLFFFCSFFLYSTRSRRYNVGQTRIYSPAIGCHLAFRLRAVALYKTHNYIENDTDKTSMYTRQHNSRLHGVDSSNDCIYLLTMHTNSQSERAWERKSANRHASVGTMCILRTMWFWLRTL